MSSSNAGAVGAVYGRLVPEEQLAALGRGLSVINANATNSSLGNFLPNQVITSASLGFLTTTQ